MFTSVPPLHVLAPKKRVISDDAPGSAISLSNSPGNAADFSPPSSTAPSRHATTASQVSPSRHDQQLFVMQVG